MLILSMSICFVIAESLLPKNLNMWPEISEISATNTIRQISGNDLVENKGWFFHYVP